MHWELAILHFSRCHLTAGSIWSRLLLSSCRQCVRRSFFLFFWGGGRGWLLFYGLYLNIRALSFFGYFCSPILQPLCTNPRRLYGIGTAAFCQAKDPNKQKSGWHLAVKMTYFEACKQDVRHVVECIKFRHGQATSVLAAYTSDHRTQWTIHPTRNGIYQQLWELSAWQGGVGTHVGGACVR